MWQPKSWHRILLSWLAWQISFAELFFVAEQGGIGYQFNQFLWFVFGTPENEYGFRNLILHRIVIFALISAPPTLIGLLVYQRLEVGPIQLRLRDLFAITCAFAMPLAFLRSDPSSDSFGQPRAALFVAMLLFATWYLFRTVRHGDQKAGRE